MKEIWKDVPGFNGWYQASRKGRIRSWRNNRWGSKAKTPEVMSFSDNGHGYHQLNLRHDGETYIMKVHQLIAKTFLDNPKNKQHVNHKNGIKTDNRAINLEWVTKKENEKHAAKNGLTYSKLSKKEVIEIRDKYHNQEYKQKGLAEEYNVVKGTIGSIIRRETWKHVD